MLYLIVVLYFPELLKLKSNKKYTKSIWKLKVIINYRNTHIYILIIYKIASIIC